MVTLKSEQTAVEFGLFESFTKMRLGSFNLTHLDGSLSRVIERSLILEAGLEDTGTGIDGTLRMFLLPCFLTHSLLFFLLGIAVAIV